MVCSPTVLEVVTERMLTEPLRKRRDIVKAKSLFTFVAVAILTAFSAAQQSAAPALQGNITDAVGLPGQAWTSMGNLSPIEHNNGYVQSHAEQRAAIFASDSGSITLTPYVSLGLVLHTKGYNWNNKIEPRFGVKLNKFFRNGVVSFGSAYAYEDRFKSLKSSGLIVYAQDWFGWQPVAERASRFPGSSWAAVGKISPVERGDILGQAYFSQGIIAKRFSRAALVPYGETTFSRDSKGFDWNNKAVYGGGIKVIMPRGELYTELGAAYLHESRFDSGRSAGGLTIFMNMSFDWNLLNRKVGR